MGDDVTFDPHPPYSAEEKYQRRIDTMEWVPNAMTEEERLEARRFEAYFAFETQWTPRKEGPCATPSTSSSGG